MYGTRLDMAELVAKTAALVVVNEGLGDRERWECHEFFYGNQNSSDGGARIDDDHAH